MKVVEGRVLIGAVDGDDARGSGQNGESDGEKPDSKRAAAAARGRYDSLESFLAALEAVAESHECIVQAFDARYVAGTEHLRSAVEHARRAIDRGENVADSPAVEVLCYAAGRRQIDRAMEMGVDTGAQQIVVVVAGDDEAAAAEAIRERIQPGAVEPDPELIESFFGITGAERRATDADLESLVLERVALLDVEK